ncbi:hypothetical protein GGR34_001587 [Microvirga flocculans]|uniref:Uncharacterized protein n=1 Tax=Microvirga flocculans TaxID=217168 RepID=A0A7W6IFJ4_9HYPH|nr:hypothetical protein [Microvirga flocculans]MBB4039940.1 hypothetical protein [Microvirga flocculans]
MLKRALPGALAAVVLGVAAAGSSFPEFAQNMPARCLPQEIQTGGLHDGCGGAVTFGMNGPMVVPGQAPDVEATGSITGRMSDDAAQHHSDNPE